LKEKRRQKLGGMSQGFTNLETRGKKGDNRSGGGRGKGWGSWALGGGKVWKRRGSGKGS